MMKSRDAVISKIFNLGLKQLKEKDNGCAPRRLSSSFKIPKQLPSVEDELKKLSAALEALETPGLTKL